MTEEGKLLYRKVKDAKKRHGAKASEHSAQADHIDPIANAKKRHAHDLFITDDDLKKVINRPDNFQEKSAHDNAGKRDASEISEGIDFSVEKSLVERSKLIIRGSKAQTETDLLLLGRAAKNAGSEFLAGTKDALAASTISLVICGTQNLARLASGEITVEEAINNIGSTGLSIAASGGGTRVATIALGTVLKNSENELLSKFAAANRIGTMLVVGSIVARATGKYLSGEVDAEGFFKEISQEGMSLIAGMITSGTVNALLASTALSGLAGPIAAVAAMAASAACQIIYAEAMKFVQEKKANEEIRSIAIAARESIQSQQEELYRLMDKNHAQWASEMNEIFQGIAAGLANNDLSQTNKGLRQLAKSYSAQVTLYDNGEDLIDDLISARSGKKDLRLLRDGS